MAKRIDFNKINRKIQRAKRNLPKQVGNIAVNHFLESFRKGGFTDNTFRPWTRRKFLNRADKRTNKSRALLVDSGALRRSIRVRNASFKLITIGSYNIPYAEFHNKGIGKLPERKFIGKSKVMNRKIQKRISNELKLVFK